MGSTSEILQKYHSQIAAWRAEGSSLSEISGRLAAICGQRIQRNAIDRYCTKAGVPLGTKAGTEAAAASPAPTPTNAPVSSDPASAPDSTSPPPVAGEAVATAQNLPDADKAGGEETIESFHSAIVAWRADGMLFPEIADQLAERGLELHWRAVERYCDRLGIFFRPKPETPPKPAPAVPEKLQNWLFPPEETVAESASESAAGADDATESTDASPDILESADITAPACESEHTGAPDDTDNFPSPTRASTSAEAADYSIVRSPQPLAPVRRWQPPLLPFAPMPHGPWWAPDLPMLEFGAEQDVWTLQDACEGTFVLGATGSGKTSGSGRTLARAFLERGMGGLVLTVKAEERRLWERYACQAGREDQLCIVQARGSFRFNFLDYEAHRPGAGAGLVENLVNLFSIVLQSDARNRADRKLGGFWVDAGKQLLRNTFRVLLHALPSLTLGDICRFIAEAPTKQAEGAQEEIEGHGWFFECFEKARQRTAGTPDHVVIQQASRYWFQEYASLAGKTRASIVLQFTTMADGFFEPAIHELFCGDTTIIPEAALAGAIIVVDLPLKEYDSVGRFAQSIWKYLFQKAIERRMDPNDARRRPVFLWIDEAQYLYSTYDGLFQSTARSSRCATVYLTQNLPAFYALAGNPTEVDGFLGNLNTKIFHANNDPLSNRWAAEQIGKHIIYRSSSSRSTASKAFWDWNPTTTHSDSVQEQMDYHVQPHEFTTLRTGSERYGGLVDAYFVKSGARYSSGQHFFKTVFQQEID